MQLYATPNLRYWPLGVLCQIYAIGLKRLRETELGAISHLYIHYQEGTRFMHEMIIDLNSRNAYHIGIKTHLDY